MRLSRHFVVFCAALFAVLSASVASLAAPGAAAAPGSSPAAPRSDALRARGVLAVASTVADLDRATRWYVDVLGAAKLGEREEAGDAVERRYGVFPGRVRVATLAFGDERLELEEFLAPAGRPRAASSSDAAEFQHLALVVRDMPAAYARLRAAKVAHISSGPQRIPDWNAAASGIEAFYFRDPDGHPLELIAYPPDKGDPRWRRPAERFVLGVDHTAVAARDTASSSAFYVDVLGLAVAGRADNHGIEQDRLNGVLGSRVAITGLRAARGFGVEFLDYVAPRESGPVDPTRTVADAAARRTVFAVDDADAAFAALRGTGGSVVSAGVVDAVDPTGARVRSFLARDPDGRFVEFRGPAAGLGGDR